MVDTPGFRFYPTEEELISFYLHQKLQGRREAEIDCVIPVVYIYDYNPWDLPKMSGQQCRRDPQLQEWFFFIPKQEREVRGGRPNRLTTTGYWKATGSPGYVYSSIDNKVIGVKRTMVFYCGRARARSGSKTEWKMNEYMAIDDLPSSSTNPTPTESSKMQQKGDYTVCRVYKKSKCLRAFDRRPGAPIPPIMNKQPLLAQQVDHPSSSDHQQQQSDQAQSRVEIMRCISESSSSSGDHQANNDNTNSIDYPSNEGININNNEQEENIWDMEIDQQGPFWEWDWDSFMN